MLDAFRGLDTAGRTKTGHILNVTIAEGDIVALAEPERPRAPYADESALLWRSTFFRAPAVWAALEVMDTCESLRVDGDMKGAQKHAWDALRDELGYESMAYVPPVAVWTWAKAAGVERMLPHGYWRG
jgi:hypothetical protein